MATPQKRGRSLRIRPSEVAAWEAAQSLPIRHVHLQSQTAVVQFERGPAVVIHFDAHAEPLSAVGAHREPSARPHFYPF